MTKSFSLRANAGRLGAALIALIAVAVSALRARL